MKPKLFVYSSLRSGFQHPAYDYISRHFSFVSDGKIRGVMYDTGSYPAVIPSNAESFITGELYEIKNEDEFDWTIAQLDDYEGVYPEDGAVPLFKREMTEVYLEDSSHTPAWVYWFNGDVTGRPVIASGDALQYYYAKKSL